MFPEGYADIIQDFGVFLGHVRSAFSGGWGLFLVYGRLYGHDGCFMVI